MGTVVCVTVVVVGAIVTSSGKFVVVVVVFITGEFGCIPIIKFFLVFSILKKNLRFFIFFL